MFAGRRYDIEIGLYYNRARYYNPYTGRFLQTDPVGYEAGMNMYRYCTNNSLNFVDPTGLMYEQIEIPINAITDDPYNNPGGLSFHDIVLWWLSDVGFFDEYSHWEVTSVSIEGDNFVIDLYCEDDTLEPEIDYGVWTIGHATVVTFNGVGRLDSRDRTLNLIIKDTIDAINDWWGPKTANYWRLVLGADSPFNNSDSIKNYRYRGKTYERSDINYLLEGHAMMHLKIDPLEALFLVFGWKVGAQHNMPSTSTLYWFLKGYVEYPTRSSWQDWIRVW